MLQWEILQICKTINIFVGDSELLSVRDVNKKTGFNLDYLLY